MFVMEEEVGGGTTQKTMPALKYLPQCYLLWSHRINILATSTIKLISHLSAAVSSTEPSTTGFSVVVLKIEVFVTWMK